MRPTPLRGFHRLTIDHGRTWGRLPSTLLPQSLPQRLHHCFPDAGVAPLAKGVIHRRPGRVLMRKPPPSASAAQHVKDPVEDLPYIHTSGPTSWLGRRNQRLKDGPFGIRKITGRGFHWGEFLLTFRLFFIHLLLLYHIFPAWLILSSRLPRPSRTASNTTAALRRLRERRAV